MGKITIGKKIGILGLFLCITVVIFIFSNNDLEAQDISFGQNKAQQQEQKQTSIVAEKMLVEQPYEEINSSEQNFKKLPLARFINDKPIDDDPYVSGYLEKMNNFQDISFEPIENVLDKSFIMKGGIVREFKGVVINGERYMLHLLYCDREHNGCIFRINGLLTDTLGAQDFFQITSNYKLKIASIDFYFCDNKRFCDYDYESYHKVELFLEYREGRF